MIKSILTCAVALCLAAPATAATVNWVGGVTPATSPTQNPSNIPPHDFRIASVIGLDVGGVTYDATFWHNTQFSTLAGLTADPLVSVFLGGPGAAQSALEAAINGPTYNVNAPLGQALGNVLTAIFAIPTAFTPITFTPVDYLSSQVANNNEATIGNPLYYSSQTPTTGATDDPFTTDNQAWVTFEQTSFPPTNPIPEPGSMALFGMGVLMLGSVGYRRRRKQKAVETH